MSTDPQMTDTSDPPQRIRKVKRDETKPACLRCTKTGRKCDGYFPQKPTRTSQDAGRPGSYVARLSPPVSPFADWAGGTREKRAFDFYRNFSAPAIFSDGGGGSALWKKLVHISEKSTASASGHVLAPVRRRGTASNTFAAEQYAKALKCLEERNPSDAATVTVPLLACLLFICIEFMLGDENASQVHINQGRLILAQIDSTIAGRDVEIIKKHFVPIYSRLGLTSFLFGSNPAEIPSNLRSSTATYVFFASVDEAEVALYELIEDGLRFSNKAKVIMYSRPTNNPHLQALQRQQEEILNRFKRWHIAFTVVVAMDYIREAVKLSSVYYHTAKVWVSTAMSPLETAYDDHITSFAAIIGICAGIIYSSKKFARDPSKAAMSAPKFVFDAEIIPPLYYTVIKCRHPMLRRAAAHLLKQDTGNNRRENLWDARMMAEIGKRIVAIEEDSIRRHTPGFGTTNWDAISWARFAYQVPVPYMQYRGLTRDVNYQMNEQCEAASDFVRSRQTTPGSIWSGISSGSSSSNNTSWGSSHLETPFNIPEYARVRNALIHSESLHGTWVTVFMDPDEAGDQHWKMTKEFVRVR